MEVDQLFEEINAQYGGEYDGWETIVISEQSHTKIEILIILEITGTYSPYTLNLFSTKMVMSEIKSIRTKLNYFTKKMRNWGEVFYGFNFPRDKFPYHQLDYSYPPGIFIHILYYSYIPF